MVPGTLIRQTCLIVVVLLLKSAAAYADVTRVRDTFTGPSGTSLVSHAPDINTTGAGWQRLYGYGDATLQSGKAGGSGPTYEVWTIATGRSDFNISVDFTSTDPTPYGGIVFRATNLDNYFLLRYDGPYLYKKVNGYWYTLGWGWQSATGGAAFHLEVRARGSQIQVYSDGILKYTVTETFQQTATKHGLLWNATQDATALMDNFEIVEPNNPPAISGPSRPVQREGEVASVQISASDPEGSALNYAASGLPPWLSLNGSSGVITGTAPLGSMGDYAATFTVSDGAQSTSSSVLWTVARADVRVYDTFTDANGTSLGSHVPNLAPGTWQHTQGSGSATLTTGAVGSAGPLYEVWTIGSGISDATITVDFTSRDATPYGGLVFRATDANNYFMLRYDGPYLYRKQNGGFYALGRGSVQMNPGETHRLEVRTHGPYIDVLSDGIFQFTVADAFQQTATTHGVMWYPTEDATVALDNFVVSVPNGAPIISGPTSQTSRAGLPASATISATDPDGATLTYGATGLPPGMAVNVSTGVISGTLLLNSAGTYNVTATASDGTVQSSRPFVWSVVAPSTLLYDTFTGNSGAPLNSHAPDVGVPGAAWSQYAGSGTAFISAGRAVSTGSAYEIWVTDVSQSDVDLSVDAASTDATPYGGVVFRATAGGDYLMLRYDGPSLYRRQNGTFTLLAWGSQAIAGGYSHRLEVHARGSQIEVLSDGVVQFTVIEPFNRTATRHGLIWYPLEDATLALDNFRINAPPSVPVILSPTDMTGIEGGAVSGTVAALDPGGAPLTFAAAGLPPGVTINSSTGVFGGTHSTGSAFTYLVTLTVSNAASTASRTIPWMVSAAPAITRIYDSFAQSNGQSLAAHAVDIGPANLRWRWLRGLIVPEIANDLVRVNGSLQSEAWGLDVGLADVTIAADIRSTDLTPWGGLVLRQTDPTHYLAILMNGVDDSPRLYIRSGDDYFRLASGHSSFNPGVTRRLSVRAVGSVIETYVDGRLQFSATTPFNQAATSHGLIWDPIEDSVLTFDNFELRSDQAIGALPGNPCLSTVSPLTMTVGPDKATYSLHVWTQPGCDWSYRSESDILEEGGRSQDGVTFSIQNNTTTSTRTGLLAVAGHTVTITQTGLAAPGIPCTYAVSTTTLAVAALGGTGQFEVVSQPGCEWTVVDADEFVHVTTAASGSGSGPVTFTLDDNTTAGPRTTTFDVGGHFVTATQQPVSPGGCTYTIAPADPLSGTGGTGTITVTSVVGCPWSATSDSDFIQIAGSGVGNGTGNIVITAAANPTHVGRFGPLQIAGQSFSVMQLGSAGEPLCVSNVSPLSISLPAIGDVGFVSVTAATGCQWAVGSGVPWLVTQPDSRGFLYDVGPNDGDQRAINLTVGPFEIAMTQEGARPTGNSGLDIVWPAPRTEKIPDRCLGNCGAGCGTFFGVCGGGDGHWASETLGEPQSLGNSLLDVCSGGRMQLGVFPRYAAMVKWTYHGVYSPACLAHDLTCQNQVNPINWVPGFKTIFCGVAAVPFAAAICVGAHPQTWSYSELAVGRTLFPTAIIDNPAAPECNPQ